MLLEEDKGAVIGFCRTKWSWWKGNIHVNCQTSAVPREIPSHGSHNIHCWPLAKYLWPGRRWCHHVTTLIKIKSYLTSVSRIDRSLYISRYVSIFLNTLLTIVNVNCRIEAELRLWAAKLPCSNCRTAPHHAASCHCRVSRYLQCCNTQYNISTYTSFSRCVMQCMYAAC